MPRPDPDEIEFVRRIERIERQLQAGLNIGETNEIHIRTNAFPIEPHNNMLCIRTDIVGPNNPGGTLHRYDEPKGVWLAVA